MSIYGGKVNTSPNKPVCLRVCSTNLLKLCGKRRNCSQGAISPFPTAFSTLLEILPSFLSILKLSSANSFSLEESKIFSLGKG